MKIYTRTGDAGDTGMLGGGRVPKSHPRVEAYGQVDELNAAIGLARAFEPAGFHDAVLETIQRDLFAIGAELAAADRDKAAKTLSRSGAPIGESEVGALEDVIDRAAAKLEPLKSFILPGGTAKAGALHVARTVCRRAERTVVALARVEHVSPAILQYLNRLSDLLFVLARVANAHAGRPDIEW